MSKETALVRVYRAGCLPSVENSTSFRIHSVCKHSCETDRASGRECITNFIRGKCFYLY
jgi:hypothetical protein